MKNVAILGSVNMDIVVTTERIPQSGETMMGSGIDYFVGGKGSNQAVAAARIGGGVSFLGKVGDDAFGSRILSHLGQEHLDITHLEVDSESPTGIASILKLPEDNCILIIPGANGQVDENYVDRVAEKIKTSDILLLQLEIPIPTIGHALKLAKENQLTTILNPAPYHEDTLSLLSDVDYLTPNEIEFAAMLGKDMIEESELEEQLLKWQEKHQTRILLTRGKEGVSFVEQGKVKTIGGHQVNVVDTTGAGDTFNGILATRLSKGESLSEAVHFANAGSALSVTKLGAQTGMPREEEVLEFLL